MKGKIKMQNYEGLLEKFIWVWSWSIPPSHNKHSGQIGHYPFKMLFPTLLLCSFLVSRILMISVWFPHSWNSLESTLPDEPQHLQGLKAKGSPPVTALALTPPACSGDVEFLLGWGCIFFFRWDVLAPFVTAGNQNWSLLGHAELFPQTEHFHSV